MANHYGNNRNFPGKTHSSVFSRSVSMFSDPSPKPISNNQNQASLDRAGSIKKPPVEKETSLKGKVSRLRSFFESSKSPPEERSKPVPDQFPSKPKPPKSASIGSNFHKTSSIRLPGTEDRIVFYFTSLHGIRRTFEDCYSVRMIFKGFRIWVDERDVSMDSGYRKELQSVLGEKVVSLPQVFIRGKYVGGADIMKHLYETGELAELLERFPKRSPGFVCHFCGDVRFVPCYNCSGSRKVFDEVEGMMKRCWCCNENGLIRCRECCY